MLKILRILGWVWAGPVTLVALSYVSLFTLLKWYKFVGVFGDAIVWSVDLEKSPKWLCNIWNNWIGNALGQVVTLKCDVNTKLGKRVLVHETEHVHQCMKLGVFQPVMYALMWLSIRLSCSNAHPYYDNAFEVSARRSAGETVDVVGILKKTSEK